MENVLAVGAGDIEYVSADSLGTIASGIYCVIGVADGDICKQTAGLNLESIEIESRGNPHPLVSHTHSNCRGASGATSGQCIA